MNKKEAKELLKCHSFMCDDLTHPKMEKGFLGMLRPFNGKLYEENYHEIIQILKTISEDLRGVDKVDREIMDALWGICHFTRIWAINKDGMLQRNQLINKNQVHKLENWIEVISYATTMILGGCDNKTAFEFYEGQNF